VLRVEVGESYAADAVVLLQTHQLVHRIKVVLVIVVPPKVYEKTIEMCEETMEVCEETMKVCEETMKVCEETMEMCEETMEMCEETMEMYDETMVLHINEVSLHIPSLPIAYLPVELQQVDAVGLHPSEGRGDGLFGLPAGHHIGAGHPLGEELTCNRQIDRYSIHDR
jgi:hypothetical protein